MRNVAERKKAERLQKQLRKRLSKATDDEEIAALNADIHIAEIDRLYAVYFPYLERYISLYPVNKKGEDGTDDAATDDKSAAEIALRSERPPLWAAIEEAAAKGEGFLERLRDRRVEETASALTRSRGAEKSKPPKLSAGESAKAPRASQRRSTMQDAKVTKSRHDRRSESRQEGSKSDRRTNEDAGSGDDEDGGGFFDFGSSGTS